MESAFQSVILLDPKILEQKYLLPVEKCLSISSGMMHQDFTKMFVSIVPSQSHQFTETKRALSVGFE